jgi:uncharacterized protein YqhQ
MNEATSRVKGQAEPARNQFQAVPGANKEREQYGGQAVVEGVMMRSPRYFAVACRRETDQRIELRVEHVEHSLRGLRWLNKPFLRGSLALIDSLLMGYKALAYSAGIQIEAETEKASANGEGGAVLSKEQQELKADASKPINNITIGTTAVVALIVSFGLFWGMPTLITQWLQHARHWTHLSWRQGLVLNLVDTGIQIGLFLGYIGLISRMDHVRRIFQYHGAEHKAINTLEAGQELTVENARNASRIHPRCGTNFIFIVIIVNFLVVALFGRPAPAIRVLIRLAVLPIVAGIAYEILKFGGTHRDKKWAQWIIAPGLALQYLTTRVPFDDQLEVALMSLRAVWDKEHEQPETAAEHAMDEPAAVVA